MVDAAPFRALRHDPATTGDPLATSAPPADELDRFARARPRTANPYSVLSLLVSGTGGYQPAEAALRRWQRTGVLVRDPRPSFYAYEQRPEPGRPAAQPQRGVLAAVLIGPPGRSAVFPHEDVDSARVEDRAARLDAVPVDLAPVLALTAPVRPALASQLSAVLRREPLVEVTDEIGATHRIVGVADPDEVAALRARLAATAAVIADGHHRYTAALRLQRRRPGDDAAARLLMLLVDAADPGTRVHGVHRLVAGGLPSGWRSRLPGGLVAVPGDARAVQLAADLDAQPPGSVGVVVPEGGFLLRPSDPLALRRHLGGGGGDHPQTPDADVVDRLVLPALGVPASSVRHRAELDAAEELARHEGDALFLLRPVDATTVVTRALAGRLMPPKATSFRPKPRTGLVMRPRWG